MFQHELAERDVFPKWQDDTADATPGKTDALFDTNRWLQFARTKLTESDGDEDSDEEESDEEESDEE